MLTDGADQWELRSARRYGSRHVGYFRSQWGAEQRAREVIERTGGVGRITAVVDNVVYFTGFEDDDL